MAVYKVPQDVEADDKLIGPFSFRQFIYLIIVAMSGGLAWALSNIFIGLAIIPLPIMLFFGALALPLRKDQPMEIYLAAIVSFNIKPRKRLWDPDGIDSLIEITAPKTIEPTLTKNITQADAEQRLSYLASLVDSKGWAIRGVAEPTNTPMNSEAFAEAQATEDVLDTNNSVARNLDSLMEKRTEEMKEEAAERMHQPFNFTPSTPAPSQQPAAFPPSPYSSTPTYDPYPTDIQQTVIQPVGDIAHQYVPAHPLRVPEPPKPDPTPVAAPVDPTPPPAEPVVAATPDPTPTSNEEVSPDIMNLANNTDLSIETIAHEAQRIHNKKKDDMSDEVVISLR